MPVQCIRGVEVCEGGVGVGVPAVKLLVSLLSSCRGSELVGRTSHELEGHGHALLIVRHVCGILRGLLVWAVAVVRVEWAAEWSACLLEYAIGRSRSSTKEEAASPEAAAHVPGQASLATCDSNRAGQAHAIPLIPQTSSTLPTPPTMQSTRAFNMLRQRAMPAFRPQQPVRACASGLSQDEVARSRMYPCTDTACL